MNRALQTVRCYIGPLSPAGPLVGGILFVATIAFVFMIVAPPLIWTLDHVFGWWWRIWLS